MWQIAQRDYHFGKGRHRTLTKATYDAIGDHFRRLWGKEAGWAHSVLFTADLRAFSAKETVKPDASDVKADQNIEIWGNIKTEDCEVKTEGDIGTWEVVKPEVNDSSAEGNPETCDQIYTKHETVLELGSKRAISQDDRALVAAEENHPTRKVKRRRER